MGLAEPPKAPPYKLQKFKLCCSCARMFQTPLVASMIWTYCVMFLMTCLCMTGDDVASQSISFSFHQRQQRSHQGAINTPSINTAPPPALQALLHAQPQQQQLHHSDRGSGAVGVNRSHQQQPQQHGQQQGAGVQLLSVSPPGRLGTNHVSGRAALKPLNMNVTGTPDAAMRYSQSPMDADKAMHVMGHMVDQLGAGIAIHAVQSPPLVRIRTGLQVLNPPQSGLSHMTPRQAILPVMADTPNTAVHSKQGAWLSQKGAAAGILKHTTAASAADSLHLSTTSTKPQQMPSEGFAEQQVRTTREADTKAAAVAVAKPSTTLPAFDTAGMLSVNDLRQSSSGAGSGRRVAFADPIATADPAAQQLQPVPHDGRAQNVDKEGQAAAADEPAAVGSSPQGQQPANVTSQSTQHQPNPAQRRHVPTSTTTTDKAADSTQHQSVYATAATASASAPAAAARLGGPDPYDFLDDMYERTPPSQQQRAGSATAKGGAAGGVGRGHKALQNPWSTIRQPARHAAKLGKLLL